MSILSLLVINKNINFINNNIHVLKLISIEFLYLLIIHEIKLQFIDIINLHF